MKRKSILLLIPGLVITITAWSQKRASFHAVIGSGVSYFRGSGTADNAVFYRNGLPFPNSIDTVSNHFGRKSYTNFSAGVQANLKILPSWILTIDALYEHSGAELTIDSVYSPSANYKANGVYKRKYDYISLNPQLGRRIGLGPVGLRISAGIDYCIKISLGGQADFTDQSGMKNSVGGSGDDPEVNDIRLTGGLSLNFSKWALAATYKYGVVDYTQKNNGAVYSRLLHVRLTYRLAGK